MTAPFSEKESGGSVSAVRRAAGPDASGDAETLSGNRGQKNGLVGLSIIPDELYILERPRVNALLEKALAHPVVLVTAGEGYGKTTAVYSFLSKRNEIAVWMPFSERDNDPALFWESVINAEGYYNPRTRKALEKIGFPETPGQLNRCYQVLSTAVPENAKLVVVLDDCHFLRGEPIVNFITRLLSFPFPQVTFVLVYRTEPEFNTMPLFSKGLLFRISAEDLRFNEEEISAYFRLRNIRLSREETKAVFADTEGWAEALNLIAEEMKGGDKKYSRSLWENGRFRVMEEALFAAVPASLRRFLVILSLFDKWPLEALEKIAAAVPEKLPPIVELTGNMYRLSSLIHYDTYLHGFRIHRAFLDYLREKQKELSREEIKTVCVIAARWCAENNLLIDAAANYGKAGDYRGLLKAVYSGPRIMPRPAAAAFLEIIDRTLKSGARDEGDEDFGFLRHVTRAGLLLNMDRFDESRAALFESIREFESAPPGPLASRILSGCYNTLGALSFVAYRQTRDISKTSGYFERGDYYYARHPFPVSGPVTKGSMGSYVNPVGNPPKPGEFETFIDAVARSIPYASHSTGGYLYGADSLCRAELAFFKGNLGEAEQYGRKAVFDAREKGQYEIESKGLFYLHRIHLCNGNVSAGRETWEQMEAQLDIPDYINRYVLYDIVSGWFNAHIGNPEQIAPWLRNKFGEGSLNIQFHYFETMVKAKSLFAEKKYDETLQFLGRKEVRKGLGSFHLGMLEISVLEAAARFRTGDIEGALQTLEAAYAMSVPNALDMPFIELGEDIGTLAGAALSGRERGIPRSWLETIRSMASVYAKKLSKAAESYRRAYDAEEPPFFTAQELSILEGISRGLTREEIAADLSLSINSVKCIIKTIYDKLGAFNSADAIRIASGMGLFRAPL